MRGVEQPAQVLLPTEIGESVKLSVGIGNQFRNHTANRTYPTIQPTITHSDQPTGPGHNDRDYSTLGSLDSGTDVPISGRNIDNRTEMNPQGPMMTIILESNIAIHCNVFDSVSRIQDLAYRGLPCHRESKSEIEKLGGNKTFENTERKNNFEVEKFGHENDIIWNHRDSGLIRVDPNHTDSNKPIPVNLTNIGSIHYSDDIRAI